MSYQCGECQSPFVPNHGDATYRYCGSCIRNYCGHPAPHSQLSGGQRQFASDRIDRVRAETAGKAAAARMRATIAAERAAEISARQRDADNARWLRDTARELGGGSL